MNTTGIAPAQGGKHWRPNSVHRILTSPTYKGRAAVGRSRCDAGGRQQPVPEEEWIYLPCPALVGEAIWDACQERLRENQGARSGNPDRRYLLTGIARCPICRRRLRARTMKSTYTKKRTGEESVYPWVTYKCQYSSSADGRVEGKPVCNRRHYSGGQLERLTVEAVCRVAEDPGLIAAAARAFYQKQREEAGGTGAEAEERRTRRALEELRDREQRTVKAQIAGIGAGADPNLYAAEFAEIARERDRLRERLAALSARRAAHTPERDPEGIARRIAAAVGRIRDVMAADEIPVGKKNALLARVVQEVLPADGEGGGCDVRLHPALLTAEDQTVPLIDVRGVGEKKFAALQPFVRVE
jgi:site-specific DNA recombinase